MTMMRLVSGVLLLAALVGCGGGGDNVAVAERKLISLGEASLARKAEFVEAVMHACVGFDGLDGSDVKFAVVTNASDFSLIVSGSGTETTDLQQPLAVALTNLSLEYPGLGYMLNDDGKWQILLPDDVKIPESGTFGIGSE